MSDDSGSLPRKLRRLAQQPPQDAGDRAGGCSFCGKALGEVAHLIAGANARICSDCLRECTSAMRSGDNPQEAT